MNLSKEQAQWLIGAIDLRVKNEGLNSTSFALPIAAMIQREFNEQVQPIDPPANPEEVSDAA